MIEIERHIEILLLSNDCVIVPGLGGFMAHHVDARYDDRDNLFLPPLRTLGFNPQLRINDSLLAQSYIEAYDISYPEALRRIEGDVNELKQHLSNEGSYDLNDIGRLYVNEDGNMMFEPCEAGILSPEIYGLSSFEINPISESATIEKPLHIANTVSETIEPEVERTEEKTIQSEDQTDVVAETSIEDITDEETDIDSDTIKIKVSWLRNAAVAAAAIIAFFIFATPIGNGNQNAIKLSNLNSSILSKLMPKDSQMEKLDIAPIPVKTKSNDNKVSKKDSVVNSKIEKKDTINKQTEKGYCIVMASCIPKSNADRFVKQLHANGYKEAYTFVKNKIIRVAYGNYKTENEAYNELRKIRDNEDFEEAWVYKK